MRITNPIPVFLSDVIKASLALFIIVDPIGTVPMVVSLTKGMNLSDRRRNLRVAVYTGSAVLVVFAIAGQQLLSMFGINLYSFMIAGGILLLLISIDILIRGTTSQRVGSMDVGAVPIAFPLLCGPGAITNVIVAIQSSGYMVALASILIVMFVTWIVLRMVDGIYRVLGKTGSEVIARLMAIFVTALAIQYVLTGVLHYYPAANMTSGTTTP